MEGLIVAFIIVGSLASAVLWIMSIVMLIAEDHYWFELIGVTKKISLVYSFIFPPMFCVFAFIQFCKALSNSEMWDRFD